MDIAQKTLAVVIPVYKSVNQLANTVSELVQILEYSKELEELGYKLNKVILVDDGSTDGTRDFLEKNLRQTKLIDDLIFHDKNPLKIMMIF